MSEQSTSAADNPEVTSESSETTLPQIHLPVNVRGAALNILAAVAVVYVLHWAQNFVISLLLGILIAYTLNRPVAWLERRRIPRALGASIVMLAVISALVFSTYALRGQMQTIVDQLPEAADKLSDGLASLRHGQRSTMQKMEKAASALASATSQATGVVAIASPRVTHVVVDAPSFKLGDMLWSSSLGVLGFLGQATMVMFLAFFLLVGGDTFKRKLVRLTGPPLSRKKITVHILDDINNSIQQYMVMLLVTNVMVAVLTWIAFRIIGLENAGAWGAAAGVVHVIPYFGPVITVVATGMAAFMQFDSFSIALLVAGTSMTIAVLVGIFVTTWMTGRIAKMNASAIFVSLLFWAWLWGVWGMLLSIPIIVIVKVLSQHMERLHPVAELLGE